MTTGPSPKADQRHGGLRPKAATSQAPQGEARWLRDALIIAALAALTAVVYAPVVRFGFVNFDDPLYVSENPVVQQGLTARGFAWAFEAAHESNWHPLTWLSLMLDATLFGDWAGGFHLTNLVLHIINVALVYLLLRNLTGDLAASACVAALFAIHPQHVESVAWVTERKDVLSTLFGLLAILAYARYVREGRRLAYGSMLVCFTLSLLSKQMLVTLPILLLLLDYWPLARSQALGWRKLIWEKLPLFGLAALFSGIAVVAQSRGGSITTLAQMSFAARASNAVVSCAIYLAHTLWPTHLAFFYPRPADTLPLVQTLGAIALLAAISASVYVERKRRPFLIVGWLWFLVTLLPVIGLVQLAGQARADRYLYVPHIGLFVMGVWGIRSCWRQPQRWLAIPATIVVLLLAIAARQQVLTWRDTQSLAQHALSLDPKNVMALITLGDAALANDQAAAARDYFQKANQLDPRLEQVHTGLGRAERQLGRIDLALQEFELALQANPNWVGALSGRGRIRVERGEVAAGIEDYLKALTISPDAYTIRNNLALAYFQLGDFQRSAEQFRLALEVEPNSAPMHRNLGLVYLQLNQFEGAVAELTLAQKLGPPTADTWVNLAFAYGKLGRLSEARQAQESAVRLDPKLRGAR